MAEVSVPDPASKAGRQLGACWGPGNSLLLHVKKSKAEQQHQGSAGEETKVHEVRWETTLYEQVFCKLVNESLMIQNDVLYLTLCDFGTPNNFFLFNAFLQ